MGQCFCAPRTKLVEIFEPLGNVAMSRKWTKILKGLCRFDGRVPRHKQCISRSDIRSPPDRAPSSNKASLSIAANGSDMTVTRAACTGWPSPLKGWNEEWGEAQINLCQFPWNRCAERDPLEGSRQQKPRLLARPLSVHARLTPQILNQDLLSVQNDTPTILLLLCKHYVSNLSSRHELLTIHTGIYHIH